MSLYYLSELSKVHGYEKVNKYIMGIKDTHLKGINHEKVVYNKDVLEDVVAELDKLYSYILGVQLEKEVILIDAYESATIEGAKTTIEEVKNVVKSNKNTKDTYMVRDTLSAYRYAYDNYFVFNLDGVCKIWNIVTRNVCENRNKQLNSSKFRTGMVYISDGINIFHTPEKPKEIENKLNNMFMCLNKMNENIYIKAAIIHFYLVYIHPFCDGNGRTARICFSSYLYHNGFTHISKIALSKFINKDRNSYYKSILESEKFAKIRGNTFLDITPFVYYSLSVLREAMTNTILMQNKLNKEEKVILTKMQKRGKNAEITVKKCSGMLNLSEQRCRIILNGMEKKGYLEKRKEGVKNIYKIISH